MGKRVDVKTGFLCNNNCLFCVQAHKKHLGNRTTEEIKKDLKASRKRCDEVVFTGGEVTVRKDILEPHSALGIPNKLGFSIIKTLIANRIPPPKYPQAYPSAETLSISSGLATWGNRLS